MQPLPQLRFDSQILKLLQKAMKRNLCITIKPVMYCLVTNLKINSVASLFPILCDVFKILSQGSDNYLQMLRLGLESVFSHCLCQITTGAHRLHLCPHALSSLRLLWIHCLCSCQVNFFTCVLDLIPFPYSSATIFFLFYCNLIMCSNLALFFLPLHTTKELLDSPSAFWLLPHSSLL